MVDLGVYRTSGLSVLQGQPLYTVLTPPPQLLPFTYPPAAALFAVPLALLPWSGRPAGLGSRSSMSRSR
jgi:alpha-1,2-mannosyltransferase